MRFRTHCLIQLKLISSRNSAILIPTQAVLVESCESDQRKGCRHPIFPIGTAPVEARSRHPLLARKGPRTHCVLQGHVRISRHLTTTMVLSRTSHCARHRPRNRAAAVSSTPFSNITSDTRKRPKSSCHLLGNEVSGHSGSPFTERRKRANSHRAWGRQTEEGERGRQTVRFG